MLGIDEEPIPVCANRVRLDSNVLLTFHAREEPLVTGVEDRDWRSITHGQMMSHEH